MAQYIAYAIGIAKPVSFTVDFGTGRISDEKIAAAAERVFASIS